MAKQSVWAGLELRMVPVNVVLHHGELRISKRRTLQRLAWMRTGLEPPLDECMLADVSDSGARVVRPRGIAILTEFVLLLTRDGRSSHRCRVAWSPDVHRGVECLPEVRNDR